MQPSRPHPIADGPLREPLSRALPGLLLDFDGTLSEIVPVPADARLVPACAAALGRLLDLGAPVAIVSGRTTEDLRERCPGDRLWLSGVHGAELIVPGAARMWTTPSHEARRALDEFVAAARALERHGVHVEDKRVAVAAHVRRVEDPARRREASLALTQAADRLAAGGAVAWLEGKAVIEVRAREVTKAQAVRSVTRRWPAGTFLIAVGDDTTDEDMFGAALEAGGTAVKVGPGPTVAPHRLADPAEVAHLLTSVADRLQARAR